MEKKDEMNTEKQGQEVIERKRGGLYKVDMSMTRCVVMTGSMSLGEELHMHTQTDRGRDRVVVVGEAGLEQLDGRERGRERRRGERGK